jgi:hypothetical protein
VNIHQGNSRAHVAFRLCAAVACVALRSKEIFDAQNKNPPRKVALRIAQAIFDWG